MAIYGGFDGTETARDQRDPAANATILSDDIGVQGNVSDNSYHVVTGSGTDSTAVLDGFTVTLGRAGGFSPQNIGAGMYNQNGSPVLANVIFSDNTADEGGGMFNFTSSPTLINVIIANSTGGGDCVNASVSFNAASANNLIEDAANAC